MKLWLSHLDLLGQEYIQHVLHVQTQIRKVIHGIKCLALLLLLPKNPLIRRIWACFFSRQPLILDSNCWKSLHYLHCTVPSRPNKHHRRTANLNFDRSRGGYVCVGESVGVGGFGGLWAVAKGADTICNMWMNLPMGKTLCACDVRDI